MIFYLYKFNLSSERESLFPSNDLIQTQNQNVDHNRLPLMPRINDSEIAKLIFKQGRAHIFPLSFSLDPVNLSSMQISSFVQSIGSRKKKALKSILKHTAKASRKIVKKISKKMLKLYAKKFEEKVDYTIKMVQIQDAIIDSQKQSFFQNLKDIFFNKETAFALTAYVIFWLILILVSYIKDYIYLKKNENVDFFIYLKSLKKKENVDLEVKNK